MANLGRGGDSCATDAQLGFADPGGQSCPKYVYAMDLFGGGVPRQTASFEQRFSFKGRSFSDVVGSRFVPPLGFFTGTVFGSDIGESV